jgi:hypothetical protein
MIIRDLKSIVVVAVPAVVVCVAVFAWFKLAPRHGLLVPVYYGGPVVHAIDAARHAIADEVAAGPAMR